MEHKSLDRREFMLIGSAAAVGVAASNVSAGTLHSIARVEGANPVLSIGFAAADDAHAVAADSLRFADGSFADAARVTVHGLTRAESQAAPVSVSVSAFFENHGQPIPFLAWTSAASTSPRVNFTMALSEGGTLPFGIESERLVPFHSPRARLSRFLSPKQLPDAAALERGGGLCTLGGKDVKLRRGTYFIALRRNASDRTPDWRSISVDAEQLRTGGDSVLRRGNRNVDFDYVAVSVDTV